MKYFTTLDSLAGYWQVELDEAAKEKTAFILGNELNEITFGLRNAPATFQRLMIACYERYWTKKREFT